MPLLRHFLQSSVQPRWLSSSFILALAGLTCQGEAVVIRGLSGVHKGQDGLWERSHDIKQRREQRESHSGMGQLQEARPEPFSKSVTEHHAGDGVTNQMWVMPPQEASNLCPACPQSPVYRTYSCLSYLFPTSLQDKPCVATTQHAWAWVIRLTTITDRGLDAALSASYPLV